jgi:hypothetical protein
MRFKNLLLFILVASVSMIGCSCITPVDTNLTKTKDETLTKIQDAAFARALKETQLAIQADTKAGFHEQKEILARIEEAVTNLQPKPEPEPKAEEPIPSKEVQEPEPLKQPDPPKPVIRTIITESIVERLPGPRWNWEGNWNVSTTEAERHLKEHGIVVNNLSMKEMEILHDNAHNSSTKASKTVSRASPVRTYSTPKQQRYSTRRSGRSRFFYSSCPGGVCPN